MAYIVTLGNFYYYHEIPKAKSLRKKRSYIAHHLEGSRFQIRQLYLTSDEDGRPITL